MIGNDSVEEMMTTFKLVQAAWSTGDPLALHREVEQIAAQGISKQSLEDALETLLRTVRATGADGHTEEITNGVWDHLTGWCHANNRISVSPSKDEPIGIVPLVGALPSSHVGER